MAAEQVPGPEADDRRGVLGLLRAGRAKESEGAREKFAAAAQWAAMHSVDSLEQAATFAIPGTQQAIPLAGPGAPLVGEFCVAELAAALGMTPEAGRSFLADVVEVRYRLPGLWRAVMAGRVEPYRARMVANLTLTLPAQGAAFVDRQLAALAGRVGGAATQRLVEHARAVYDPEATEAAAKAEAEKRRFDVDLDQARDGVAEVSGALDVADAMDLEAAVRRGAAELKAWGSQDSLDVRRSQAVGLLAREQLALDLNGDGVSDGVEGARRPGRRVAPRQVVIYAHLSASAITGIGNDPQDRVGTLGNLRVPITAEQVRAWCGDPLTAVTVREVIDLSEHHETASYAPTDRLREAQQLIDRTCVWPYCSRPALGCDCDHVEAHADGGATCSCNLADLCRTHHRIKTHTSWSYAVLDVGTYLWRTPNGLRLLREPDGGTREVTDDLTLSWTTLRSEPPDE